MKIQSILFMLIMSSVGGLFTQCLLAGDEQSISRSVLFIDVGALRSDCASSIPKSFEARDLEKLRNDASQQFQQAYEVYNKLSSEVQKFQADPGEYQKRCRELNDHWNQFQQAYSDYTQQLYNIENKNFERVMKVAEAIALSRKAAAVLPTQSFQFAVITPDSNITQTVVDEINRIY